MANSVFINPNSIGVTVPSLTVTGDLTVGGTTTTSGLVADGATINGDMSVQDVSATTVTISTLTAGRVAIVGASGLLEDDAGLTYNKTTDVLTVGGLTLAGGSAANVGAGLYLPAGNQVSIATTGIERFRVLGGGSVATVWLPSDASTIQFGASQDAMFTRGGANNLQFRNSTSAQRLDVAKTWTSASSNAMFSIDAQTTADTFIVGPRTAATGTVSDLALLASAANAAASYSRLDVLISAFPLLRQGLYTTPAGTTLVSTAVAGGTINSFGNLTATNTSGAFNIFAITPTYNQASGTAANTDLLINRTQTAVGSGAQLLLDAQVSTVSKFSVDNTGVVVAASTIQGVGGYKSSDGTAGATAGPFTVITSITVKNGLVTALAGS